MYITQRSVIKSMKKKINTLHHNYTAWQVLLIKGSFFFFIYVILMTTVSCVFQIISKIKPEIIFATLVVNSLGVCISFFIFKRIKQLKNVTLLQWFVVIYLTSMPIITKYNYALRMDWTFGVESYNLSAIIIAVVMASQLFYNKKIFGFLSAIVFINWLFYLYLAYNKGVVFNVETIQYGKVVHGIILFREFYYMIAMMLISILVYRNIPIAINYDQKTVKQQLQIEKQKEEIQEYANTLEVKVEERTTELKLSNEALIATRDQLWGEMQLAKRIQQVLIPPNPIIDGYAILGYMQPADDVGGDYYDVININGYSWVVIGDVSGHGVPAGLIMMMVQTAIHNTLEQNPTIAPSMLLDIINKTIYKNIKRLNDDKYMTITVISVNKEGGFEFSGLHQDILIYRDKSKSIEVVETDGMWIGIFEKVDNFDMSFKIETDDIVLLFTDGITEARSKLNKKEMFGNERLQSIFKKGVDKNLLDIKDTILRELKEYDINDDVTFLLLKKL